MSIQGHSGNEIADLLGISINTVKTQKNRGFKYLREKLKRFGFVISVVIVCSDSCFILSL